jgi:hypothetical protein
MKRFQGMQIKTPGSLLISKHKTSTRLHLTPIIEDFNELALSSKKKGAKDDFAIGHGRSAETFAIEVDK